MAVAFAKLVVAIPLPSLGLVPTTTRSVHNPRFVCSRRFDGDIDHQQRGHDRRLRGPGLARWHRAHAGREARDCRRLRSARADHHPVLRYSRLRERFGCSTHAATRGRVGAVLDASVALSPDLGYQWFCLAFMAGPAWGFDDYVFFTGEETDDIVDVWPGAEFGADPGIAPQRQGGYAVALDTSTATRRPSPAWVASTMRTRSGSPDTLVSSA